MKYTYWRKVLNVLVILLAGMMIWGCDSGKEAIDEAAGRRALKQYQKSKKNIEQIEDKQDKRYESIPGDEEREGGERQ
jgi:hypothetical protein